MDDINTGVGGYSTQDPGSSSVDPATVVPPPSVFEIISPLLQSSIEKSEVEAMTVAAQAGVPTLPPPNTQSYAEIKQQVVDVETKIIASITLSMMSTAQKSDQTKRDEVKADQIKADQIRQDQLKEEQESISRGVSKAGGQIPYLMSMSVSQRAKEINGISEAGFLKSFDETFKHWFVSPITSGGVSGDYPDARFVAACMAVAIGSINNDSASFSNQSVSPVSDALAAVGPHSNLPGDEQSAAAMVAAMLYSGALNKANSQTVQEAVAGGKQPQDLDFALNFAKQILAIIVPQSESGAQPANPKIAGKNNLIRLMLATIALNMLYRAGYGGMTGTELKSLLEGNTGDIPDEIREALEKLVAEAQKYLPEDPEARQDLLNQLAEYVDSKESYDSMLETTHMLKEMMKGVPIVEQQA